MEIFKILYFGIRIIDILYNFKYFMIFFIYILYDVSVIKKKKIFYDVEISFRKFKKQYFRCFGFIQIRRISFEKF